MKIRLTKIISQREYKNAPSFQSVFEWEDIIAKDYPLKIVKESLFQFKVEHWIEKIKVTSLVHYFLRNRKSKYLRFIMKASSRKSLFLNKNVIPVIIDFWLNESEFGAFYKAYRHCPLVLISSAEVIEKLKQNNCPLHIAHWPLSLSDRYPQYNNNIEKKYDLCFIGRPNPYFERMLSKYALENPDFIYVISKGTEKNREYYTNKGKFIGKDTGRDSYINMINNSKITCYSTPGIDEAKRSANMYNQVTPRLFEMISGGCFIIGHYPDNPDTRYYELEKFVPNINNYIEFKTLLDEYRMNDIQNIEVSNEFLKKHYTTTRIPMLKKLIDSHANLNIIEK